MLSDMSLTKILKLDHLRYNPFLNAIYMIEDWQS